MQLPVLVRRLWFDAKDELRFPDGKAANALRGGFGLALRSVAPADEYERIFEPKAQPGQGPSGFADPPRPFLFRASHLDGVHVEKHDDFHFDIHIFGDPAAADSITGALEHLFNKGAGVGRGRAVLTSCADQPVTLALDSDEAASVVTVGFLTPTELKHQGLVVSHPDFPVLIRRVRDRVSNLMTLYGDGEPELDPQLFGATAELVQTVRADIDIREVGRTSGRTGQTHTLGGMVGEAEYSGPITRFLPFLRAAHFTGVGRHTVWGNGWLETTVKKR